MIPWIVAGLIGGVLLVAFWDEIVNWLKDLIPKIQQAFQAIAHAAAAFIEKVEKTLAAIRHKLYYKENGQWIEETTTRKIEVSEVPERIRRKLGYGEEEITEEVEAELGMEL